MAQASPIAPAIPSGELKRVWFPRGLVGCPEWQHFRYHGDPDCPLVGMLECEDIPGIALPVASPALVCSDYSVELSEEDAAELEIAAPEDAVVLVVLVAHEEPRSITANLLGPLIVNRRTGKAKQLVLGESGYSARHPVDGVFAGEVPTTQPAASPEETPVSPRRAG